MKTITVERVAVTVPEFAAMYGFSKSKAFDLVWSGLVPSFKIGRNVRIRIEDARAFADACRGTPAA